MERNGNGNFFLMPTVVIVPSCTMFDRANSNVKLASSSQVESSYTITGAVEYEYERSSVRGPILK